MYLVHITGGTEKMVYITVWEPLHYRKINIYFQRIQLTNKSLVTTMSETRHNFLLPMAKKITARTLPCKSSMINSLESGDNPRDEVSYSNSQEINLRDRIGTFNNTGEGEDRQLDDAKF